MLSPSGLLGIESSSGGEVLAAGWLFQNRDYPVLNEYRALFGGLFVRLCGLNAALPQRVFPRARPKDLALV